MSCQTPSDELLRRAISSALDCRLPFAAYSFPGSGDPVFFADDGSVYDACDKTFAVAQWGEVTPCTVIHSRLDAAAALDFCKTRHGCDENRGDVTIQQSTTPDEYSRAAATIIGSINRGEGRKVVLSRASTVVDDALTAERISDIAASMLTEPAPTFRHIYYTPATGAWMGSTPETLVTTDRTKRSFHTMALAGTMVAGNDDSRKKGPAIIANRWDEKNIEEHRIVADYIAERLAEIGIKFERGEMHSVKSAGAIEHLCTPFEGTLCREAGNDFTVIDIIKAIHPTPAIAGYPVDYALRLIERLESHRRGCYAGYVMVSDDRGESAFVNLRCCRLTKGAAVCYAGGGIVGASLIDAEWRETDIKLASIPIFS